MVAEDEGSTADRIRQSEMRIRALSESLAAARVSAGEAVAVAHGTAPWSVVESLREADRLRAALARERRGLRALRLLRRCTG
jgi:hypothetical protein